MFRRFVIPFFLMACFALSAGQAEELESYPVTIYTQPSGATIYDNLNSPIGKSGEVVMVRVAKGQLSVILKVRKDGFVSETISITSQDLDLNGSRYPWGDGEFLELQPDGLLSYFELKYKEFPYLFWALGLLLAGGAKWSLSKRKELARASLLENYRAEAKSSDSLILSVLGNYRIIKELGEGGMAKVYCGLPDTTLDPEKQVAIKVMHRELAKEEEHLGRFHREIDTYRQLQHRNIVQLLDWGEVEGRFYLTLEYVEGENLEDRLESNPPKSNEQVAHLLSGITDGVDYAHGKGVVHRDLKPSNIMLNHKGQIKLMDFGLAKSVDAGKFTQTGTVVGTPAYMAPEQIQSGEIDPSTDQYALGCIAYELLTGRTPFVAEDPIQLIFHHMTETPEPPSTHREGLSAEVDEIVLRMLAKAPEDRFPTVRDAGDALQAALL